MSDFKVKSPSASFNMYLLVPILLFFVLLIVATLRSPGLISSAGVGSAVIVVAPLILATYALMAVAIAGRATVDLSVGPLIGFINVTLIQLHGADIISSPLAFFVYAFAVGIAYQLLMALIIIYIRVQPIIVALSGFLALSGINLVIMSRPGGTAPDWMMPWGLGTSIYSPVLVILILATAGWIIFSHTAFYDHLRLMGSDERAAYTSGVHITLVRLGAHVIAGVFSALAALVFTALIGSGDPTQGTTYTLIAVTALVLGGTSLAGGRGGVIGSLLGALNLFFIGYVLATFSFGSVQGFVTDLAYGIVLVVSLLLTVALPHIQRYIRAISPYILFVALLLVFLTVSLHKTYDYGRLAGYAVATAQPADLAPVQDQMELNRTSAEENTQIGPEANATDTIPLADKATLTSTATEAAMASSISNAANAQSDSAVTTLASAEPAIGIAELGPSASDTAVPASELALVTPEQMKDNATPALSGSKLGKFIFEPAEESSLLTQSRLAKPVTFAAILILSFVVIVRAMVLQTGVKTMTPLVFVIIVSLVILAAYFLATSSYLPPVTPTLSKG